MKTKRFFLLADCSLDWKFNHYNIVAVPQLIHNLSCSINWLIWRHLSSKAIDAIDKYEVCTCPARLPRKVAGNPSSARTLQLLFAFPPRTFKKMSIADIPLCDTLY